MDSDHDAILEVKNLSKIYGAEDLDEVLSLIRQGVPKEDIREQSGAVVGVRDASFTVQRGEFFVIMGLSGSGKSTLIRCLIRLIEPSSGEILLEGNDVAAMDEKQLREVRRSQMAMVFQHYGLLPHKTVLENVEYGLKTRGIPKEERHEKARAAVEQVGLQGWEDERPSSLSGGMQQRVGLARALAHDPQILLMDEPFSGLDPLIRGQMQDEFATLQEEQDITTVFVTHDLDEALNLGDRIAIMRDGEIIQIAEPAELVMNPVDDYVAQFVEGASASQFMSAENLMNRNICIFTPDTGFREAIAELNAHDSNTAYIVDHRGLLRGHVEAHFLIGYDGDGRTDPWDTVIEPTTTTQHDTPIQEIVPIALRSDHPVAVVDESGKLLGAISQSRLLQTLASDLDDGVEQTDSPESGTNNQQTTETPGSNRLIAR